jgi:predicted transcriptional regulator
VILEAKMDATQNVTLAIPKDILRKAKILAVQRNTSLSGLLTQTLADLVAHQEAYERARERNLAVLNSGFDLGTQGNITWKRDELHER